MFDRSEMEDETARFENLVASHLLKLKQYLKEYEGYRINLSYLRNIDKKEVDFYITVKIRPGFVLKLN